MITVQRVLSRKDYSLQESAIDEAWELGASSFADAAILIKEPGWTLFDFDHSRKLAFFLDVGAESDLFCVPFCYTAQQRVARRVAAIPFEEFVLLASGIKSTNRLIQFYNTGHCGSTLLHHVFNESGETWSISEPQFTQDIALYRTALPIELQQQLAKAGLAFLSLYPRAAERKSIVVKHFSQCTKVLDIWQNATPNGLSLYMYRDALNWVDSMSGFVQRHGIKMPIPFEMRHFIWMIQSCGEPESYLDGAVEFNKPGIKFYELGACAWALHMQEILEAHKRGLKPLMFRYNELLENRQQILQNIFSYCGFDPMHMEASLRAFDQDAHKGESSSHDKPVKRLTKNARQRIRQILSSSKFRLDPDMIL